MIRVQLPDGEHIRVDTDDPQAAAAAARKFVGGEPAAPAAPPVEAPPAPTEGTFGRKGTVAAQGAGLGLSDIIGAPVDLGTLAVNLASQAGTGAVRGATNLFLPDDEQLTTQAPTLSNLPGSSSAISELFGGAIEDLGFEGIPKEEQSGGERLLENVVRFGTGGATAGKALATKAAQRQAGRVAGETAPKLADKLLSPFAGANAGRAIATETAAGAGSGAGVTAAQELLPDSPIAEFFASVIGGLGGAGALATARGGKSAAKSAVLPGGGVAQDIPLDPSEVPFVSATNKDADQAAQLLQNKATDPAKASKTIGETVAEAVGQEAPVPTSGIASGDVGLIGLEQGARAVGPDEFRVRDTAIKTAAADKVASIRPEGANKRAPQQFAQEKVAKVRGGLRTREQRAEQALADTETDLAKVQSETGDIEAPIAAARDKDTKIKASQQLDEVITDDLKVRTEAKNTGFEKAAAAAGTIEATGIKDLAKQIKKEANPLKSGNKDVPSEFIKRLETVSKKNDGALRVADLMDIRKDLGREADRAQTAGQRTLSTNIRVLKKDINEQVDAIAESGAPGSKEIREAQRYYKAEYAPFYATGAGREFRDKVQLDPTGRTVLEPSRVAEFWLNNTEEKAAHLNRILQGASSKQEGAAAVRSFVISDLARASTPDGKTVNIKMLNNWIDDNPAVLNAFPELKKEVTGLRGSLTAQGAKESALLGEIKQHQSSLKKAAGKSASVERHLRQAPLGILLNNSPENAVRKVLSAGDPVKAMTDMTKTLKKAPPFMRENIERAWDASVADHFINKVRTTTLTPEGNDTVSYAQLAREWTKNEEVFQALWKNKPEKLSALRQAQTMLKPLGNLSLQATKGSATAENIGSKKLWNTLELAFKVKYGILKGGGVTRTMKIAAKRISGDREPFIARLIERAMFEPEVAQHLLTRDIKAVGTPAWNAKLNRLLGVAAAQRSSDKTQQKDER